MPLTTLTALFITCAMLVANNTYAVIHYRIGTPFSSAEKDSLESHGAEFREISWSASQVEHALELDSLQAGVLQPNFFASDEDIATTLYNRDGWVSIVTSMDRCFCHWNKKVGSVLIDEDPATSWTWAAVPGDSFHEAATRATVGMGVLLDMGGRFLVREIRLRPQEGKPEHFLESYDMGVSDRGFDTYRPAPFPPIVQVRENTEPEIRMILNPPLTTEAVQIKIFRDTPKELSIGAVEIYGGGFSAEASYKSDVIELDDIGSWGQLNWSGRQDPKARVEIRTRSGSDPQPDIFWESRAEQQDSVKFLGGGGNLTLTEYKQEYFNLSDFLKPVDIENRTTPDIENWSLWSSTYLFDNPGVNVTSPGPRKFIQISADFASTIDDGGKIDYIEFKASVPPAVRRLLGEIFPIETEIGQPTQFTYYIRPTIRSGDTSFDGIEISTPSGFISVDSLRLDGVDHADFTWKRLEDDRGFEILLPRKLEQTDTGALIEVVFSASVLREVGSVFDGRVFDTSRPGEVRQQVLIGNATDNISSERLSVTTSLSTSLVLSPSVFPNPFTPNGDGINDAAIISYKLLRITTPVPVNIKILDIGGRLVKQIHNDNDPIGEYSHTWDGREDSGKLVPPGLYLYRIVAEMQSEQSINSGIISVVY